MTLRLLQALPLPAGAVEESVARLGDLREGPGALGEVIALGSDAVPYLGLLLRGRSESVPQPRCLAAQALGAIGGPVAFEVLLRALEDSASRDLEPVERLAEDAVCNRIAESLSGFDTEDASDALLAALRRRPLAACAEGLGRRRDARAVPRLVECLEDDFARDAARKALAAIGDPSVIALARALFSDEPGGPEATAGNAARVAAVEALEGMGSSAAEEVLASGLSVSRRPVRIASAIALAGSEEHADRCAPILVEALGGLRVGERERVARALATLGEPAEIALFGAVWATSRDERAILRAIDTIAMLGRLKSSRALHSLAGLSHSPEVRLRRAAVAALSRIPDPAAVSVLGRFLGDPERAVRGRTLAALASRGPAAARMVARALGDSDRRLRRHAETELRAMGDAAIPGLLEARQDLRFAERAPISRWRIRRATGKLIRRLRRSPRGSP